MIQGLLTNLRAIELDDTPLVHGWFNNPAVMEGWGLDVAVISRTITAERISSWIDQERTSGRPVAFVIERALDSGAIGLLVANPVDAERRIVMLSLLIGDPGEWGQGFGADALDAFLEAAFDGWNFHRIELEVEAGNTRAERLYAAAGFRQEAVWRGHRLRAGVRCDVTFMAILQAEWRDRQHPRPHAHQAQDPDELFDVLRGNGESAGHCKPRWKVHRDGDWHRAIHVWICGIEDGQPFIDVQLRGPNKDTWPGRLDATVGGHLRAGETVAEAYREIEEEAGIAVNFGELVHVGTRRGVNETGPDVRDREIQEVHFLRRDAKLDTYRANPDEVGGFVRVGIEDVIGLLTGERQRIPARRTASTDRSVVEIELSIDNFIPTLDRYFLRVAIAARQFLAGGRLVVV
jgi:RimJ/RimL family protein N-acetyltransferase/isopentenyldiphosphate isomerase